VSWVNRQVVGDSMCSGVYHATFMLLPGVDWSFECQSILYPAGRQVF